LALFSEIVLSDLLPLCSQLLFSSVNVDELSLLPLCILSELLNELKLNDSVLSENIRLDIQRELQQTFLPIICDRHIVRDEAIALLSLRFVQNLCLLNRNDFNLVQTLLQSKLIANVFVLIQVGCIRRTRSATVPFILAKQRQANEYTDSRCRFVPECVIGQTRINTSDDRSR
jgi:hypothetical protein